MTNYSNDIRSLLSLAFEVEGLLMLAERRDDMTPAEVLDMLADKCAALLDGVASLRDTSQSQTVTSPSPALPAPAPATAGADDEALAEAARFEDCRSVSSRSIIRVTSARRSALALSSSSSTMEASLMSVESPTGSSRRDDRRLR